jgi:hypothetical protein
MRRSTAREHLRRATEPLLQPDEEFSTGCAVWMADLRPRVPLVFTGRAVYLVAVTSRRMLVFDTPRRGRPLLDGDLLLQRRHVDLQLLGVRGWTPMLQVRIAPAPGREVVLEFRPLDRRVGRVLVAALRDDRPADPSADAAVAASA